MVTYTNQVVYLSDEEIAVLRAGAPLKIVDLNNVECPHEAQTVALNIGQLEKGGFPPLHAERNLRPARLHQRLYAWARESGYLYGHPFRRIQLQGTTVACRSLHYRGLRYFLALPDSSASN